MSNKRKKATTLSVKEELKTAEGEIKVPEKVAVKEEDIVPVKENSLLKKLVDINSLLDSQVVIKTTAGVDIKGKLINIAYDNIFVLTNSGVISRCAIKMIQSCKRG